MNINHLLNIPETTVTSEQGGGDDSETELAFSSISSRSSFRGRDLLHGLAERGLHGQGSKVGLGQNAEWQHTGTSPAAVPGHVLCMNPSSPICTEQHGQAHLKILMPLFRSCSTRCSRSGGLQCFEEQGHSRASSAFASKALI